MDVIRHIRKVLGSKFFTSKINEKIREHLNRLKDCHVVNLALSKIKMGMIVKLISLKSMIYLLS